MGEQDCSIYVRAEAIYAIPHIPRGGGQYFLSGLIEQADPGASPDVVGAAVLRALDPASRFGPHSGERDDNAVVRPLGFASFGRFERGAKLLNASREGDRITLTPALAYHGGWMSARQSFTCPAHAEAIGRAFRDALAECTDDGKAQVPPAPQPSTGSHPSDTILEGDTPVGFGYKMCWLALRSEDTHAVVDALRLHEPRSVGWQDGIDEAYGDGPIADSGVFVTPAVNGWSLVVGIVLPDPSTPAGPAFLAELSRQFGEAQYFGTHRGVGCHVWARAIDGRVVRAYGNGDSGFVDVGEKTAEEIALGFNFLGEDATEEDYEAYEARDEDAFPDEEHVISLAGLWSIDPTELDREESHGYGVVGELPAAE